eukprot:495212-Lingulodinium_polyedra.AAC.1
MSSNNRRNAPASPSNAASAPRRSRTIFGARARKMGVVQNGGGEQLPRALCALLQPQCALRCHIYTK